MVPLVWAVFLLRCGCLRFLWWWMLEGGMLAMGLSRWWDGSGRVGALAGCRTDSNMNRNAGNVGVVDMASGPGFVAAGFVVAGLVAGGVAVVTGAVGAAVVYSTGMCTGRGTVGGEGEGGRGGVFSVFCACGVVCVSCVFWILGRGVGMKRWRPHVKQHLNRPKPQNYNN